MPENIKNPEHKIEVLAGNEWLQLRKLDDWYTYAHEIRTSGFFVAILGFDSSQPDKVLMRYEDVPPHMNGIQPVAFTGGVEVGRTEEIPDATLVGAAAREFREESGYEVNDSEMISLGLVHPSKGSDTRMLLFAVDLKGKEQKEAKGDGTRGEQSAYSKWEPLAEAIHSSEDAVFLSLVLRALSIGIIKRL